MVKEIPVSKGKCVALVDDEDYAYLTQWKWRLMRGYAVRNLRRVNTNGRKRTYISMHREINKTPAGLLTDHINRNKLDNRKENLRTATQQQNQWNKPTSRKNPSSHYKGVSFCAQTKKWRASIEINGKYKSIGRFSEEINAAQAYNFYAFEHHGEYAFLNRRVA